MRKNETYTPAEFGNIFGYHAATIRKWIRNGKLKPLSIKGEKQARYRFTNEDVDNFWKNISK